MTTNGKESKQMVILQELTDHSIQSILKEVDFDHLALALKDVPPGVRDMIVRNMSRRASMKLQDEMEFIGKARPENIAEAQKRIESMVAEKLEAGELAREEDGAGGDGKQEKQVLELQDLIRKRGVAERSSAEMVEIFLHLSYIARRCGILALEKVFPSLKDDDFLAHGIRLAIDGTDPELIQALMERKKQALLQELERRLSMEVTGVMSVQSGDHPRITEQKCLAHLPGLWAQ